MGSEIKQLRITNDQEAWDTMRMALSGDALKESFELVFDGWPKIQMKFTGEDWKKSIPTRLLPSIMEMQKELHRTYAAIHYGEANSRRLTDREREQLEMVIQVEDGSAEISAAIANAFNTIAAGAATKMQAKDYLILLLGSGVLFAGTTMWKNWLQLKAKEVDSQAQVKINGQAVEAQAIMSEQETERLKIFRDATKESAFLKGTSESVHEIRNSQLKAMKPEDLLAVDGIELKGSDAQELTHKPREHSAERRIDGEFRVELLDATQAKGFKIKVRRMRDGLEFHASVGDLDAAQLDALKGATWNKQSIGLEVNARELRGSITAATVIGVATN